jgi:putative DNA primase/helicase
VINIPGVTANANNDCSVSADELVAALGGNPRTGMCCCPAHDDSTPSLWVTESANGRVRFYCHAGCSYQSVIAALEARGLWPIRTTASTATATRRQRSPEERGQFALKILGDTRANRGQELAEFLADYFRARGITTVPPTAMLALPWHLDLNKPRRIIPDDPAMVFEVTDGQKIIGCHATWLNSDLTDKREEEPKRQFFGPVSGGFIRLYAGELDAEGKLIIAEGVETALVAAQRITFQK